jgi:hypothetical protein
MNRRFLCDSANWEEAMHVSYHAAQRMNQRGISRRLMEFTLHHGRIEGNKRVLDRKESRRIIDALTEASSGAPRDGQGRRHRRGK